MPLLWPSLQKGVRSASAAAANFSGASSNRRFAHTGLQRMATPQEIAAFALVLASQDHPYMTGAQMVLDGGKTAHAG